MWSPEAFAVVTEVSMAGEDVVLSLEAPTYQGAAMRPRPAGDVLPTLQDVLNLTRPSSAWRTRDHTGHECFIVDWAVQEWSSGYGRGVWNLLTSGGGLPSARV